MNNQALFSSKDKSKTIKCRLLQSLFGALRVKPSPYSFIINRSGAVLLRWLIASIIIEFQLSVSLGLV